MKTNQQRQKKSSLAEPPYALESTLARDLSTSINERTAYHEDQLHDFHELLHFNSLIILDHDPLGTG